MTEADAVKRLRQDTDIGHYCFHRRRVPAEYSRCRIARGLVIYSVDTITTTATTEFFFRNNGWHDAHQSSVH